MILLHSITGQVVCTAMSLSLSLRTLSNSLNHRSRLLAIRHSSRGVNQPLFDRYGAIRSFFKRQRTVELLVVPPSCGSHNGFRRSTMDLTGNVESLRQFHSCARRDRSGRPRKETHNDHGKSSPDKPPNANMSSEHPLNVEPHVDKHPTTGQAVRPTSPNAEETGEKPLYAEEPPEPPLPLPNYENYPKSFRRLAMSLPHLHRPTRDDFLNVASGFWQRARIRFKWFTIKSFRKFDADDISAFVTWFLTAQFLWIFVGT